MLSIFNRRHITNNMQIRSEIVSKFSKTLKFLGNNLGHFMKLDATFMLEKGIE